MCGIVGYTGPKKALPILTQGLRLLEYRGYDSSGIALAQKKKIAVFKKEGKLGALEEILPKESPSQAGIGHTRWATHGAVTQANAHPHMGFKGRVTVVHNGIIDNYQALKTELEASGVVFASQTDSEVIAHLVELYLDEGVETAVMKTLARLQGTYGLAFSFSEDPELLVAAKNGSPLVLGVGDQEMYIGSDPTAFAGGTRRVVFLEDGEVAFVRPQTWETRNLRNQSVEKSIEDWAWGARDAEKGDHEHYFIKEIQEQPEAVRRAFGNGGRLIEEFGNAKLGGLNLEKRELLEVKRVVFLGMGTALYAGMIGAKLVNQWARIPASAEDASELEASNPIVEPGVLYLAVSQSGETADTISLVQELQEKGGRVLGVVNAVGSTLARLTKAGVYTHAGPEISVASSKAFSSQVTVLSLLALMLGRMRNLSLAQGQRMVREILSLPEKIQKALDLRPQVEALAKTYSSATRRLFIGRGILYPLALEGALKMKELSYTSAEGLSAGGLKHGPLALVDPQTLSVFLVSEGDLLERNLSSMAEVKARKGPILCITNSSDPRIASVADQVLRVPETDETLAALVMAPVLQYLAYYTARDLGLDVDRPRNLAKSVTTH